MSKYIDLNVRYLSNIIITTTQIKENKIFSIMFLLLKLSNIYVNIIENSKICNAREQIDSE